MNNEEYLRLMGQWLKQIQEGSLNPTLTQNAATHFTTLTGTGLRQLSMELESDADDAEVEKWLQAALADTIPIAKAYPKFDLSFLSAQDLPVDIVRKAMEQGKQWVSDQVNTVYILCGQLLQGQQEVAWAVRSGEMDQPIFHRSLNDENLGWEIEISAFTQNETSCRIEVAIFRPEDPDADLDNVAVTLSMEDKPIQTLATDIGGVVEFTDIPRARLDQVVVQIAFHA